MGRADDSLGQAGLKELSFPRNSARKTAESIKKRKEVNVAWEMFVVRLQ